MKVQRKKLGKSDGCNVDFSLVHKLKLGKSVLISSDFLYVTDPNCLYVL